MHRTSQKLFNSQSDIWDAHEPVEGEFTLLPVGVPPLITTAQEMLLANDPSGGGEGYSTSGQVWSPKPLSSAYGTLLSGEDFFPFYRNGTFWYTRQIRSMVLNGLLFDSGDPQHAFSMEQPSFVSRGFYRIVLTTRPSGFTFFDPIITLVAGQTLTITDITLATP
jgi:hypothetical protein